MSCTLHLELLHEVLCAGGGAEEEKKQPLKPRVHELLLQIPSAIHKAFRSTTRYVLNFASNKNGRAAARYASKKRNMSCQARFGVRTIPQMPCYF